MKTIKRLGSKFRTFLRKEEGQGFSEYGVIILFVVIIVIAVATIFGQKISNIFSNINSKL